MVISKKEHVAQIVRYIYVDTLFNTVKFPTDYYKHGCSSKRLTVKILTSGHGVIKKKVSASFDSCSILLERCSCSMVCRQDTASGRVYNHGTKHLRSSISKPVLVVFATHTLSDLNSFYFF